MKISEDFIKENSGSDPSVLRLKYLSDKNISAERREIIENSILQIECRRKFKNKFSSLLSRYPGFIFPSYLSGEQASHNCVSRIHAYLVKTILAQNLVSSEKEIILLDMTAGLGLDFITISSTLSQHGKDCIAIEMDPGKCEALRQNLNELGLYEASVFTADSIDYLRILKNDSINLIFIDPARRGAGNSRVFNPEDCQPDIVGNWEMILDKGDYVMVKLSSMLDLHRILNIFPGITNIAVVSVRNECKEILIIAKHGGILTDICCINIIDEDDFESLSYNVFKISAEDFLSNSESIPFAEPNDLKKGVYLYEPNSSVMKTMAWTNIYRRYDGLKKLSPNCHIFTSDILHNDFPGRVLRMEEIIDKSGKKQISGGSLNVVTRNYPQKAEILAKSLRLKGSRDMFLYGVTVGRGEKPLLIKATLLSYQ